MSLNSKKKVHSCTFANLWPAETEIVAIKMCVVLLYLHSTSFQNL